MSSSETPNYLSPEDMKQIQPARIPRELSTERQAQLKAEQEDAAWQSLGPDPVEQEKAWARRESELSEEYRAGQMSEARFRERAAARQKREMIANSKIDVMTGLANEEGFHSWLAQEIERQPDNLWLIAVDLDHFKLINDTFGHGMGDRVLHRVAEVFHSQIREDQDLAARPHGDEFWIGIDGASEQRVREIAQGIIETTNSIGIAEITNPDPDSDVHGQFVDATQYPNAQPLQMSIGLAHWQSGMSVEDLLARADSALYDAKEAGRNTYAIRTDRPASA